MTFGGAAPRVPVYVCCPACNARLSTATKRAVVPLVLLHPPDFSLQERMTPRVLIWRLAPSAKCVIPFVSYQKVRSTHATLFALKDEHDVPAHRCSGRSGHIYCGWSFVLECT